MKLIDGRALPAPLAPCDSVMDLSTRSTFEITVRASNRTLHKPQSDKGSMSQRDED